MSDKMVKLPPKELWPASPFTDFPGLMRFLPMWQTRTLRRYVNNGVIPVIRLKNQKMWFHLPSVEAALLKLQTGGMNSEEP